MASTETRPAICRQRESTVAPGTCGFASDYAIIAASSAASGFPASNLQRFLGLGTGAPWRSTGTTAESLLWDFGTPTALRWCHVAGAGAEGIAIPSFPVTFTLKADNANPPTTTIATLTLSRVTGDHWLTFDLVTARYAKLFLDAAGGGPVGYFQIARAALDTLTVLPTGIQDGFSEGPDDFSYSLDNEHGVSVPRYGPSRSMLDLAFSAVGNAAGDLSAWNEIIGYAGEADAGRNPRVPMWLAPAVSGWMDTTGQRMAPRFCWISNAQRWRKTMDSADPIWDHALQLPQCMR